MNRPAITAPTTLRVAAVAEIDAKVHVKEAVVRQDIE
jgi:hypothetical protein